MNRFEPHFEDIELNVYKFGGTSMLDIPVVASRIEDDPNCRVFTASAFGNSENDDLHGVRVTPELTRLGKMDFASDEAHALRDELVERHVEQARRLGIAHPGQLGDSYQKWFEEAAGNLDYTKYLGERMSTDILGRYMGAVIIDALDVVQFADAYSQKIDMTRTALAMRSRMTDKGATYGIPGFGGSYNGQVRTLPLSGTDRTGSLTAVALGASRYTNSKEIDGVRSADPRYVRGTRLLDEITYKESREMGNAGMSVLMRDVILDLAGTGIETVVRNTFNPEAPGTRVVDTRSIHDGETIIAVGARDNLAYLKAHMYGMNEEHGVAARVIAVPTGFALQPDGSGGVALDYAPMGTDAIDVVYDTSQFEGKPFNEQDFRDEMRHQFEGDIVGDDGDDSRLGALHLIGQAQQDGMTRTRVQAVISNALLDGNIQTFGETGGIREASSVILIRPEDYSRARQIAHDAFFSVNA